MSNPKPVSKADLLSYLVRTSDVDDYTEDLLAPYPVYVIPAVLAGGGFGVGVWQAFKCSTATRGIIGSVVSGVSLATAASYVEEFMYVKKHRKYAEALAELDVRFNDAAMLIYYGLEDDTEVNNLGREMYRAVRRTTLSSLASELRVQL